MDATLKRRMWKVAKIHFGLSFCDLVFVVLMTPRHVVWNYFWVCFGLGLQPQFFFLTHKFGLTDHVPDVLDWVKLALLSLTIPVWSICFGWLFVKLDNWLNHFPVLGKRVF